jgi:hypothetical protein
MIIDFSIWFNFTEEVDDDWEGDSPRDPFVSLEFDTNQPIFDKSRHVNNEALRDEEWMIINFSIWFHFTEEIHDHLDADLSLTFREEFAQIRSDQTRPDQTDV